MNIGIIDAMACKFIGAGQRTIPNNCALKAHCGSKVNEQQALDDRPLNGENYIQLTPKGRMERRPVESGMNQDECRPKWCSKLIRRRSDPPNGVEEPEQNSKLQQLKSDMVKGQNSITILSNQIKITVVVVILQYLLSFLI